MKVVVVGGLVGGLVKYFSRYKYIAFFDFFCYEMHFYLLILLVLTSPYSHSNQPFEFS